ncbi:MAG TPA: putative toxin-antitoxin system toxin component, PIN family [Vicinamibacteria bacterium]|nr:putative toxin-antitoxin system toxin component, PIN family [Vicinamibacteria bacterium]
MGEKPEALRVVLDTNTVLSALLFAQRRLTWLRESWESGRINPLCSDATIEELLRALAYPKFGLTELEIMTLLRSYVLHAQVVLPTEAPIKQAPKCRDADDQKFLDLAFAGGAEVLVTGDRDLLALADEVPFAIESPALFIRRFE